MDLECFITGVTSVRGTTLPVNLGGVLITPSRIRSESFFSGRNLLHEFAPECLSFTGLSEMGDLEV